MATLDGAFNDLASLTYAVHGCLQQVLLGDEALVAPAEDESAEDGHAQRRGHAHKRLQLEGGGGGEALRSRQWELKKKTSTLDMQF